MDFIQYLEKISPADWQKMATDKWAVHDVVAHMVGWEQTGVQVLERYLKTGKDKPWFVASDEYDDFNAQSVNFYKNFTPQALIKEWQKYQTRIGELIEEIGEEKLRANKDMQWLFDEEDGDGHYAHHLAQIKAAV